MFRLGAALKLHDAIEGIVSRLALVLATSALLLLFDFGSGVLATNDETRFPVLARDILAHGNWLMPQLNGVPHLNKPALHAWLIALISWSTGSVTPRSAALPSILAALGVVLGTYWIARRLFGADVAVVAGLVVVTTYGVFSLARAPMPDMTLCAAFTAAVAAYVAAEFDGRRVALVAFYVLIGLAFWTKGPVGLLPLAVVGVDVLVTYGRSGLTRLALAPGLLLLGVLLAPWWVLAASAGHEQFWRDVVRNDLLLWYLPTGRLSWRLITEPVFQALTIVLPWSLLLPVAVWSAARTADAEPARRARLLLLWAGTMFVLVAVAQQQRMRYYLPLCPPAALLIAVWYGRLRWPRRMAAFGGLWAVAALGLSLWQISEDARATAATDLRAITRELRETSAPVYAVKVPELVFTFYLERPVILLSGYPEYERRVQEGRGGYLIVADWALPTSPMPLGVHRVATGFVNRRPVSVLAVDQHSPVRTGANGGRQNDL